MGKRRGKNKRLFPVRYASDYIDVQRRPNPEIMETYRNSVKSTVGPKHNMLPISGELGTQNREYSVDKSNPEKLIQQDWHGGTWDEKLPDTLPPIKHMVVLSAQARVYQVWQGHRHQGVNEFYSRVYEKDEEHTLTLFFSGQTFVWLEEKYGLVSLSVVYGGMAQAMKAYMNKKILWKECVDKG